MLAIAACDGGSPPPAPSKPPADAQPAGVAVSPSEVPRPPWVPRANRTRPIDVLLKSTPPGAYAYVDGYSLGKTPTQWLGENDGREHVFEFTYANHVTAHYQFIPITNGVVHARLEPLGAGVLDAGLPIEPAFVPDAAPTSPPDAAPRTEWRPPPRVAPDAAEAPDAGEPTSRPGGAGPAP
jgi:hypothetical protein